MYHRTSITNTVLIHFLDEHLKESGLAYDVASTATLSFPDYPSNLPTSALPELTITVPKNVDGVIENVSTTLVNGANSFVLFAGALHADIVYNYFPTDGKEYSERTKRAVVKINFDEAASPLSSIQNNTFEIYFQSPDTITSQFSGSVTDTVLSPSLHDSWTTPYTAIISEFPNLSQPSVVDDYLAKLIVREISLEEPLADDEVIVPSFNYDWLDAGRAGDPAKMYGRDIPIWVRQNYPPIFIKPKVYTTQKGQLIADATNTLDSAGFQYWDQATFSWVKAPNLFNLEQPYRAKFGIDKAADSVNLTDIQFVNTNFSKRNPGIDLKEQAFVLPAGTSRFRIILAVNPPDIHKASNGEAYSPFGIPYPDTRLGCSMSFVLYTPRFTGVPYSTPRSLPMRSAQWFVLKNGEVSNEVDEGLAFPTYRLSDGRGFVTSNDYALNMSPGAAAAGITP